MPINHQTLLTMQHLVYTALEHSGLLRTLKFFKSLSFKKIFSSPEASPEETDLFENFFEEAQGNPSKQAAIRLFAEKNYFIIKKIISDINFSPRPARSLVFEETGTGLRVTNYCIVTKNTEGLRSAIRHGKPAEITFVATNTPWNGTENFRVAVRITMQVDGDLEIVGEYMSKYGYPREVIPQNYTVKQGSSRSDGGVDMKIFHINPAVSAP